MREELSEHAGVLGDAVGPGDGGPAADSASSPEPFLVLLDTQVHELLGQGHVIEGHRPHAATGTQVGNLGPIL